MVVDKSHRSPTCAKILLLVVLIVVDQIERTVHDAENPQCSRLLFVHYSLVHVHGLMHPAFPESHQTTRNVLFWWCWRCGMMRGGERVVGEWTKMHDGKL